MASLWFIQFLWTCNGRYQIIVNLLDKMIIFTSHPPSCDEYILKLQGNVTAEKTDMELQSFAHTIGFLSFLHVILMHDTHIIY